MNSAAVVWNGEPAWSNVESREVELDWGQRMALATAEDTARGLFLQSVLKAIRAIGDEELARRCSLACGQGRFADFFNYPLRVLLQMFSTAMPVLAERHGAAQQSLWLLGHCVAMDFLESEAGRTMQVLVRGEARRMVTNLPWTYQVSVSGERSVEWVAPQACRFTMDRDFLPPAFHEGMLVAMLERLHATQIQVHGRRKGLLGGEYDISWQ
jgi:uncharacterized protein (TIGR02265 family)